MSRVFRQQRALGWLRSACPARLRLGHSNRPHSPVTPNLPNVTAPDEVTQPQPLPDIPGLEIVFGFVYDGVTLFDPIEFDQLNLDELLVP